LSVPPLHAASPAPRRVLEKNPLVVVAFTRLVEVAKRLDEVELVVLALVAARNVEVELVNTASVAVRDAIKALVKVSPEPEILVVEAVERVV
jgi:hypothetical protein